MDLAAFADDFYEVLEVDHSATPEEITRSYRGLAFKYRKMFERRRTSDNRTHLELLDRAYEILNDEYTRRKYDLLYPTLCNLSLISQGQEEQVLSENVHIAALEKSKRKRAAQWQEYYASFRDAASELKRDINRLVFEIEALDNKILDAEESQDVAKKSWKTRLVSPFLKAAEEKRKEQAAQKEQELQECRAERELKEEQLSSRAEEQENLISGTRMKRKKFVVAEQDDDEKILAIQAIIVFRTLLKIQVRIQAECGIAETLYQSRAKGRKSQEQEDHKMFKKCIAEERAKARRERQVCSEITKEKAAKEQEKKSERQESVGESVVTALRGISIPRDNEHLELITRVFLTTCETTSETSVDF